MNYQDYIEIGYIPDVHGIKGQVKVKMDVQEINNYKKLESVYLASKNGIPISYEIAEISFRNSIEGVIRFKGISTREEAEALVGSTLFIEENQLPPLEEGGFYYFEVIGYTIKDSNLGELGRLEEILEMPGGDIIVMLYQKKEVLIPLVFSGKLEKEARILNVTLPEGLLETYLS